jgi:hypothetical protein
VVFIDILLGSFLVASRAILGRSRVKAFHPVVAVRAKIAFGERFLVHLVTLSLGKPLEMAGGALETARFRVVIMAEYDWVHACGFESDVPAADSQDGRADGE